MRSIPRARTEYGKQVFRLEFIGAFTFPGASPVVYRTRLTVTATSSHGILTRFLIKARHYTTLLACHVSCKSYHK